MTTDSKTNLSRRQPKVSSLDPNVFPEAINPDATPYEKISIKLARSAVKGLRSKNPKTQQADADWINGSAALIPFEVVCGVLGLSVELTQELIADRTGHIYMRGKGIILRQTA
jgi:hypothetical protein